MNVKERIFEWLKKLKSSGEPVEVTGFYQELPIRVKVRLLDFDGKFVQWESEPKLCLAAGDDGKLFFNFLDPFYGERRILGGDVTYYGSSFIETTFPLPASDPRFGRECVRVRTSPELPVKVFVLNDGKEEEFPVIDISEEGVGAVGGKGFMKIGQPVKARLLLPQGNLSFNGEVVSVEPYGDGEKFGIKLLTDQNGKKLLRDYVMTRQREILNKIREIAG